MESTTFTTYTRNALRFYKDDLAYLKKLKITLKYTLNNLKWYQIFYRHKLKKKLIKIESKISMTKVKIKQLKNT